MPRVSPGVFSLASRHRLARFGILRRDSLSARRTTLATVLIGSHVSPQDPLAAAEAEGADVVQIFLGNPQSWKAPKPRDDAAQLKAVALQIFVHALYLVNVTSANNRGRIPSRKILQYTCDAAAQIGTAAVIVHGGHVSNNTDLDEGFQ